MQSTLLTTEKLLPPTTGDTDMILESEEIDPCVAEKISPSSSAGVSQQKRNGNDIITSSKKLGQRSYKTITSLGARRQTDGSLATCNYPAKSYDSGKNYDGLKEEVQKIKEQIGSLTTEIWATEELVSKTITRVNNLENDPKRQAELVRRNDCNILGHFLDLCVRENMFDQISKESPSLNQLYIKVLSRK